MNDTPTPTPRTDNFKSQGREWLPLGIFEKVERELTAAREELKETKKHLKDANRGAEINAHALRINADKLAAVTEQRDGFKKELEIANLRLKGKRHPDDNGIMADGEIDVKAVTEQRDRLEESLQKIVTSWDEATWLDEIDFESFRETLQSIN